MLYVGCAEVLGPPTLFVAPKAGVDYPLLPRRLYCLGVEMLSVYMSTVLKVHCIPALNMSTVEKVHCVNVHSREGHLYP